MEKRGDNGEKGQTAESLEKWSQHFLREGGTKLLMKEYEGIKAAPTPPLCAAFNHNTALNRYGNIHLIDETRVMLTDGLQPEYMHANYVDGYKSKRSYILTQIRRYFTIFLEVGKV